MMLQNKTNQAGNVFIMILLGVFLFGALMYMFSRSAQQGTGNLTKQQASIAAQEILNYARLVQGAVDRVRRNGCSETEISFENAVATGYTNPNAPLDKSCHIFEDEGGKMSIWFPIPESLLQTENKYDGATLNDHWQKIYFWSGVFVAGSGKDCPNSSCNELVLIIPTLKAEVCLEINAAIGISRASTGNGLSGNGVTNYAKTSLHNNMIFNGDYVYINSGSGIGESNTLVHNGKQSGCFSANDAAWTNPTFYHVLLAR